MLEQGPNIDVGNIYTGDRYLPDRVRKLGLKTMPIDGKSRPNVSSLKLGHTSREDYDLVGRVTIKTAKGL